MSTTFRKTAAIVWTQDPSPLAIRKANALAFASDVGLTLRNIHGYAFETVPPGMILRNIHGYAFERAPLPLPLNVTGDLALYQLINNNVKPGIGVTWSASNSTLGTPAADSTYGTTNTRISITAGSNSGYGGSVNLFYTRRPITDAITGSVSLGTIASDTTVVAMLPTINSKYGLNLTAQDVVDGVVKAGATFVTITIASGSWVFLPGSTVAAGNVQSLSSMQVTALPGFDDANGVVRTGAASFLLHMDTVTSGTGFDAEGHTSTGLSGGGTINSTYKAFGASSASLAGGTDCIYVNASSTGDLQAVADMTLETWVAKRTATPTGAYTIACDRNPQTAPVTPPAGTPYPAMASFNFYTDTNGNLFADIFGVVGVNLGYNLYTNLPAVGTFVNLVFQVIGTVLEVYVSGQLVARDKGAARNGAQWTPQITIGNDISLSNANTQLFFDETRFSLFARYYGPFTAPSAQYSATV